MRERKTIISIFLAGIFIILLATNIFASTVEFYFNTSSANDTSISLAGTIRSPSVLLQITTDKNANCRYSTLSGQSYDNMVEIFDLSFETKHEKTLTDLTDGVYKYYVKCKGTNNNESKELEAVFNVNLPITAQVILPEGSPTKAGKVEVTLITSKVVSSTPSLSYSFDGISYTPIPLSGSKTIWNGNFILFDSIKEEAGSFKFQARDLEGNLGTEISSGGLFLVDNIEPATILDIKSEGYSGSVELKWYFDEEAEEFKIYKSSSAGVSYSDFYKTVNSKSFTDTFVDRGKTYYYRIQAIDEAGNGGDLSPEVYATVLIENISVSSSGLEPRFIGKVDELLSDIDVILKTLDVIKSNFNQKEGTDKNLYLDLKLKREIDSGESELNALRREVSSFKSQDLSENELDRKLNAGRLKLSSIKKKIPENILVVSEKTASKELEENDLTNLILEIMPAATEKHIESTKENSMAMINGKGFNVEVLGFNLEIIYLDGTKREVSLIKEKIDSAIEKNENVSIIEVIPKSIIENVKEMDIKNTNYEILKDDLIVSFESETKEIVYSTAGHVDLNLIKEIKTVLLHEVFESEKSFALTGYFAFADFGEHKDLAGIIIGILIALCLLVYFYFMKKNKDDSERIIIIKEKMVEAKDMIKKKDLKSANELYISISEDYKNLGENDKKKVYKNLEKLHKIIKEAHKK